MGKPICDFFHKPSDLMVGLRSCVAVWNGGASSERGERHFLCCSFVRPREPLVGRVSPLTASKNGGARLRRALYKR
jgi:hypothetical protein